MSGRWSMYRRLLVAAALLLPPLATPSPGSAQAADDVVRERLTRDRLARELEARLEVLDARLDSFASSRAERREEPEPWRVDTARVGPFVVLAREDQSAVVVRAVQRALAMVESEIGSIPELRPRAALRLVLYGPEWRSPRRPNPEEPSGGPWMRLPADAPHIRHAILGHALTEAVAEWMPPAVRDWTGGRSLPLDVDWPAVRSELLGSAGASAVGCVTEGGEPCLAALGLAPGVGESTGGSRGDDVSDPMSARGSLLADVLARDPDALGRLLAADADAGVVSALERAADAPMADVVVDWRSRLVDAGPLPDLPRTLASTLVWLVLFTGFAARSTRWRLG